MLHSVTRMVRHPSGLVRGLCRCVGWWWQPARHFLTDPPGHYYSALPDASAIESATRRAAAIGDELPGLDLDLDSQFALLRQLAPYAREWPFQDNVTAEFRYHARNGFFSHPDGSVLLAILRQRPPARVVEVGSGFSSALMLDWADRQQNRDTEFTFIDPYPDRLLGLLTPADRQRYRIIAEPVQAVDTAVFATLSAGDILFIDSSHVCKLGSDLNHLLFEVLPRLAVGVRVHIHDVQWPFEYAENWLRAGHAWNEAYVVRAFLLGNRDYRVMLWPSYLESRRPDEFRQEWPFMSTPGGAGHASLWLERLG